MFSNLKYIDCPWGHKHIPESQDPPCPWPSWKAHKCEPSLAGAAPGSHSAHCLSLFSLSVVNVFSPEPWHLSWFKFQVVNPVERGSDLGIKSPPVVCAGLCHSGALKLILTATWRYPLYRWGKQSLMWCSHRSSFKSKHLTPLSQQEAFCFTDVYLRVCEV